MITGGGDWTDWVLDTVRLYDPLTDTWLDSGPMTSVRLGQTATLLPSGQVVITGGYNYADVLASTEIYDDRSGTSKASAPLAAAHAFHTATLLPDGSVLVLGGRDSNQMLGSAELLVLTRGANAALYQ